MLVPSSRWHGHVFLCWLPERISFFCTWHEQERSDPAAPVALIEPCLYLQSCRCTNHALHTLASCVASQPLSLSRCLQLSCEPVTHQQMSARSCKSQHATCAGNGCLGFKWVGKGLRHTRDLLALAADPLCAA